RPRVWAFMAAGAFTLVAMAVPVLLGPLHRLMQRFARLMHALVSPVVLAVMFFAGITPMGLLMRLLRRDPLRRRFEPDLDSYWIDRPQGGPPPDTMRNQF